MKKQDTVLSCPGIRRVSTTPSISFPQLNSDELRYLYFLLVMPKLQHIITCYDIPSWTIIPPYRLFLLLLYALHAHQKRNQTGRIHHKESTHRSHSQLTPEQQSDSFWSCWSCSQVGPRHDLVWTVDTDPTCRSNPLVQVLEQGIWYLGICDTHYEPKYCKTRKRSLRIYNFHSLNTRTISGKSGILHSTHHIICYRSRGANDACVCRDLR